MAVGGWVVLTGELELRTGEAAEGSDDDEGEGGEAHGGRLSVLLDRMMALWGVE